MAPASYSIHMHPLDLAAPSPSSSLASFNPLPPQPPSSHPPPPPLRRGVRPQWEGSQLRRRAISPVEVLGATWFEPNGVLVPGRGAVWRAAEAGADRAGLTRRDLAPNDTQKVTLGVIGAYAVIIKILWNVPVVHWVLWPFKMLTIAFHELGHAATGCCTGAKVKSITLDPREGGCTMMAGGVGWITLPAGYCGSAFIGALLVFCSFDIRASKIISIFVGVCFLFTAWWGRRDWLTILTILIATGLIVAFWFIAHGAALRFYIMFLGVMNSLYALYDICDDLIFRKVNSSDASVFAERYGGSSACWGVIWCIFSLCFLAAGIVAGLAAFKDTFSEQASEAKHFLPTRLLF
ncbi:hypothetical protein JCM10213_004231 [Rhodosporidiobolus nylandii]